MINRVTRTSSWAAMALALAATASADIKVNENFSVSGYVVGLADYTDIEESNTSSTMDLQATKFIVKANFSPVSGVLSYYAGADGDPLVLDAFATYDFGGGLSATGGKYLSWLGYEAFDPINMMTVTYAWQSGAYALNGIPAYHTGLKIETSSDTFGAGFSVSDSNRVGLFTDVEGVTSTGLKGDGDLDNGVGLEAYFTVKSGTFTLFVGGAYDTVETEDTVLDDDGDPDYAFEQEIDSYSIDIWAQYVTGAVTLAGEFCFYNEDGDYSFAESEDPLDAGTSDLGYDSMFWGVWAKLAATDKIAYVARIAGGTDEFDDSISETSYMKYTFCPIFTLTANLEIVGEVSYTTFDDFFNADDLEVDSATYVGVQGRFKF